MTAFVSLFGAAFAAIALSGVSGDGMRARAFFDANNVKVGDPIVLSLDFFGKVDFTDIHPPRISRHVDSRTWKVDDESAKTGTFSDARRITYRVRPLRDGVIWFPALDFEYAGPDGSTRIVRSNAIPVHAKPGADVVVAGMAEAEDVYPDPCPLVVEPGVELSDDESFAWRKACAQPTADAFSRFPFPAAKMNEARCATLAGDWKRALAVYSRLEWRVGQTPEIERGVVAALARRYANPGAELPVWRQVGRPLLRHGWKGRLLVVASALAASSLFLLLCARAIRFLACIAVVVALSCAAQAQQRLDPFARIEQMQREMDRRMQQMMSTPFGQFPFGQSSFVVQDGGQPPKVTATAEVEGENLRVGEGFSYIISMDIPKNVSTGAITVDARPSFGMRFTARRAETLADGVSKNPSNVVKRIALPVRYDVPFKGNVSFALDIPYSEKVERRTGGMFFSSTVSNSLRVETKPVEVDVRPLDETGRPEDFSGTVAEALAFDETTDIRKVETNDVVCITYTARFDGYMPDAWMPKSAAFEIGRTPGAVQWRRFFVADGAPSTPTESISYYDTAAKAYRRVTAGGTPLEYVEAR